MASNASIAIRRYTPADHDDVVRIWQLGFLEMANSSYADARLPFAAVLAGSAVACAVVGWRAAACVLGGATVAWLSPLGLVAVRAAMWQSILAQTRATMAQAQFESKWLRAPNTFLVAHASGQVVGCVAVRCGSHTLQKEQVRRVAGGGAAAGVASPLLFSSVWRLSVDAGARHLGIGRLLMEHAEAHAAAQDCKAVTLITGNPASKAFYARLGYKPESLGVAASVVFGPTGRPARFSPVEWLKSSALRFRISKGNVLRKDLTRPLPLECAPAVS